MKGGLNEKLRIIIINKIGISNDPLWGGYGYFLQPHIYNAYLAFLSSRHFILPVKDSSCRSNSRKLVFLKLVSRECLLNL